MVIFSNRAKFQLKQIHDYIKRDSIFYAKKIVNEIISECKKLDKFPHIGRIIPELDNQNIREIFLYSYRLIYEFSKPETIHVLAIIHCRKNFTEI